MFVVIYFSWTQQVLATEARGLVALHFGVFVLGHSQLGAELCKTLLELDPASLNLWFSQLEKGILLLSTATAHRVRG